MGARWENDGWPMRLPDVRVGHRAAPPAPRPGRPPRLVPFLLLLLVAASPVGAQGFGLGFEGGVAFVERFDSPVSSFGLSLLLPVGTLLVGEVAYSQWTGKDADDTGAALGHFFGRRGLNLAIYAPAFRTDRFAWLLGGGVGQYERIVRESSGADREYQGALSLSTMVAFGLGERWTFYLKALMSAPTAEATPRWGITHSGLALRF